MISRRALVAGLALGAAGIGPARAQAYPTKPIKLIVPFAPGGPADVMARIVTQRMSPILGQAFVLENRPGAGGTFGARAAAQAEPDGYTLLMDNTSTLVIAAAVYKSADYDPEKNFAPIAAFGTTANSPVGHAAAPPDRRDAQAAHRHRHRARALQGRRAGGVRRGRRAGPDDLREPVGLAAAGARRPDPGARQHRRAAQSGGPRDSDHDRGGRAGFCVGVVHRARRPGRRIRRYHRAAQCRRQR